MKKIGKLFLFLFLIIPFFKVSAEDIYDVILFWGQSNMVGYESYSTSGINQNANKKDYRLVELGVDNFSTSAKIDKEIVQKYTAYNHVPVPVTAKTVYEYKYDGNKLAEISSSTATVGEKLVYSPSDGQLKKCTQGCSLESSYGTSMAEYFAKIFSYAQGSLSSAEFFK